MRLRVLLGGLAAAELAFVAVSVVVSQVIGFFADAFLAGGFHVGPAPKPLYSPYWEWLLVLVIIMSCAYYLVVALTEWSRWLFATGLALHVLFLVALLAFCWNSMNIYRNLAVFTLVTPVLWILYARKAISAGIV